MPSIGLPFRRSNSKVEAAPLDSVEPSCPNGNTTSDKKGYIDAELLQRNIQALKVANSSDVDRFLVTLKAEERDTCSAFSQLVARSLLQSMDNQATVPGATVAPILPPVNPPPPAAVPEEIINTAISKIMGGVEKEMVEMRNSFLLPVLALVQGIAELKASVEQNTKSVDGFAKGTVQVQAPDTVSFKAGAGDTATSSTKKVTTEKDSDKPKVALQDASSTKKDSDEMEANVPPSAPARKAKTVYGEVLAQHYEDMLPSAHYDVNKDMIGEGGFGSVFIGKKIGTGEEHAIKSITKASLDEHGVDIWREIKVMEFLDHPHVLRLYATYEDSKHFFLVTELCGGGELFDAVVETESGFTEKVGSNLMKQMLQAVGYLHSVRICHRDLKPENFLLARKMRCQDSMENANVKLIDFGTAKMFSDEDRLTTKVCTVHYVAPEILTKQAKPYTEVCDLWSLGVVMYMLLCGAPPFEGPTDMAIMKLIKKGKYKLEPPEVWDNITRDGIDLLKKMLEVNPDLRYSAMEALDARWIAECAPDADSNIHMEEIIKKNMNQFKSAAKLKKIALQVIGVNTSEDKIPELRKTLESLDAVKSGCLKADDIEEAIKASGMCGDSARDMIKILHEMVHDCSGHTSTCPGGRASSSLSLSLPVRGEIRVKYGDFLNVCLKKNEDQKEKNLRAAFAHFDIDGDGTITKEELCVILGVDDEGNNALGIAAEEIEKILQEVDADGDGTIDFEEFTNLMNHMH